MDIFCKDTKLNLSPYYLKPGFAYGGSCLPKEVRAVSHIAREAGVTLPMIETLGISNRAQIEEAIRLVRATGARRVGVLGVAFKAGTDDLRESPVLEVIAALREDGIEVVCHDPAITAQTNIAAQLGYVKYASRGLTSLAEALPDLLDDSLDAVIEKSDALIVTQKTDAYEAALRTLLADQSKPIVDVVRAFAERPVADSYTGIGW